MPAELTHGPQLLPDLVANRRSGYGDRGGARVSAEPTTNQPFSSDPNEPRSARQDPVDRLEDGFHTYVKMSGLLKQLVPFSVYVTLDSAAPSPVRKFSIHLTPEVTMSAVDLMVNLQSVDESVFEVSANGRPNVSLSRRQTVSHGGDRQVARPTRGP